MKEENIGDWVCEKENSDGVWGNATVGGDCMHKGLEDLMMPEDLRVGPKMGLRSQLDAEQNTPFPIVEPGEAKLRETDCITDVGLL